ncbi:MAG: ABC transporter substrate-binding protein [Bacteroidales bacterium]|nr:ABC transporter substrate-binding protein [Bacteroidales bacterium]
MYRLILFIYVILLAAGSCRNSQKAKPLDHGVNGKKTGLVQYAQKFDIEIRSDHTELRVFSPWQNASDRTFRYLLADDAALVPDSIGDALFIQTPVSKVVTMSTTYVAFLDTLDEVHSISGVSGGKLYFHAGITGGVREKSIRDVGYNQGLNYETLLDINPDVVFMFGVQSGINQTVRKLNELGIPVVLCADYLEPHPLGRAEWLKFFSAFYNKELLASRIYDGIAERYDSLSSSVSSVSDPPKILMGLPWKNTWYAAGGNSFAAKMIDHAGGRYIWHDLDSDEAVPLGIEAVFYRAVDADIWINPGIAADKQGILRHDQRFARLSPFINDRIFSNNKRITVKGGNDYWESGVLRPDMILDDLIKIFHDTTVTTKDLYYYTKLE